jgi:hypothetical protein
VNEWINEFDFDSDEQRKGYYSFVKWTSEKKVSCTVNPIDLFFIQRDHESNEWWRQVVSDQVKSLEAQIHQLQKEIRELKAK